MSTKQEMLRAHARYGPLTRNQLHKGYFSALVKKSVDKASAELEEDGLVTRAAARGNEILYGLTPAGARRMGLNEKRYRKPPGAQAVIEHQVMFYFCRLRPVVQDLKTRAEFVESFPALVIPKTTLDRYYVDVTDTTPRLGLIVPDYGAELRRLVRRVRRQISIRWGANNDPAHATWRRWIEHEKFQVTVITGTDSKARRLRESLRESKARVVVVVVPEIADLLIRRKKK